jgi:hypothetical protein
MFMICEIDRKETGVTRCFRQSIAMNNTDAIGGFESIGEFTGKGAGTTNDVTEFRL